MLDLLDLAQIENNSFKINEEFFNLHEVIDNSFNLVKHLADRKQVRLVYPQITEQETEIFKRISGDSRRYMQIIINFLSNALKFSKQDS